MKQTARTKVRATKRPAKRTARETRASYRTKTQPVSGKRRGGWRIPAVTPIGAPAPVSETLPVAVKRIADALQPEKIILFGSYAYGTPTPDSDVDLLVVLKTSASSTDRSWSVSRLLIPRPFPVDILVRTPSELARENTRGNNLIQEIVSKGKILYERPKRPSRMD